MNTLKKSLKALEWQNILEHLANHITCSLGKEKCFSMDFINNPELIKKELSKTTQAKLLLDTNLVPPLGGISNVMTAVGLAKTGYTLKNTELIDIATTIGASRKLKSYFERYKEEAPVLNEIGENLFESRDLEEEILNTFDKDGNVLDNATPTLRSLKTAHKDTTANLKSKLNRLIATSNKYLQDSMYTIRSDRFVVPVKAEHKVNVPGIVHDASASGATLFIEPKAIVELNNSLKEIEFKIENEIQKILAKLTLNVKENAELILYSLDLLGDIDLIFAKAKYSIELNCIEPSLNKNKEISLKSVKHPILMKIVDKVVANDIELGKNWNTLVITGSNTGGKTITLKCAGLSVLMTKTGMHLPCNEASIYPFTDVFADIGDEQSVIQSLSTFSAHLTNIINILNKSNKDSLVLFDEIGAGTDPSEGSSLAQAILEDLTTKEIRTIITTHFGELKALAYTKEGFQNASVEFDTANLTPTYKLLIGIPGKSNAITIASNLGLSQEITDKSNEIFKTQKDLTGEIMEGIQNTQRELSLNAQVAKETKEEALLIEEEYNKKLEIITAEKKKTIGNYKKKFETQLLKAREEIKEILNEVRNKKSEKIARRSYSKLQNIEENLRNFAKDENDIVEPEFKTLNWETLKIGDTVLIKDLKQQAEIISLPDKNKNVQVQIGQIKTYIKKNRLAKFTGKIQSNEPTVREKYRGFSIDRISLSDTLDLRGDRVEEGLSKLEDYLDKASLGNLSIVFIIHGHGTGALKEAVRSYLKTSPYITKFRPGKEGEGSDGVSVLELK